MAFIDNSGDIILDAVLSDTGRQRLARGDGSFRITKFAVGDDEINYELYDKTHASGSAFYDLAVLQTPVLEAFTNNTSTMKSRLISIPRTNLLYLPILKLNEIFNPSFAMHTNGAFAVAVDNETEDAVGDDNSGIIYGETARAGANIRIDQGLDTTEITPSFPLPPDLLETQFMIEIDHRFASVVSLGGAQARVSFIDDDNVASYLLSLGTDPQFVERNTETNPNTSTEVISGPRGTFLKFSLRASLDLNTSEYLFDTLGGTDATSYGDTVKYIDSVVRVSGATTGYRIDIPLRFIKLPA